jgi:hypothetical protein
MKRKTIQIPTETIIKAIALMTLVTTITMVCVFSLYSSDPIQFGAFLDQKRASYIEWKNNPSVRDMEFMVQFYSSTGSRSFLHDEYKEYAWRQKLEKSERTEN